MAAAFLTPHMALAGLVGAAAEVAGGVVGPLFSPLVELSGAALTAALAAHAVHGIAGSGPKPRPCTFRILARVTTSAHHVHRRLLAAKALDFACSLRSPSRAMRTAGSILGQVARSRVLGLIEKLATCWCPAVAGGARVVAVSRSAFDAAHFLKTIQCAAANELLAMDAAA